VNGLAICAGVEGIELGIKFIEPNYKTVCYVEGEAYAAAVLRKRMEEKLLDEAPIWDDVKTFSGLPWRGKVDILSAGFPCQPWSYAGKQEGEQDERWIWPDIARVIGEVRPHFVFLENVPGLISGGGLLTVLGSLAEIGYNARWATLSAADVGANHKRERVWIFCWDPNSRNTLQKVREIHRGEDTDTNRISGYVAHPHIRRELQQEGSKPDVGGWPRDSSKEMADTKHVGLYGSKERRSLTETSTDNEERENQASESKGGREPKSSGNLQRGKRATNTDSNPIREEQEPGEKCQDSPIIGNICEDVSNTNGKGREKILIEGGNPEGNEPFGTGSKGRTNGRWWAVEPDVGRVANGVPHRVDRLRACGNGVVPLVAATAYRELKRRALTPITELEGD
jgi:DNA (cytosine-5)-methyltransferase 1